MSQLDPTKTSVGDLCNAALQECGAIGQGQVAVAEQANVAWARLQWMLQQWANKRWMVYHLVTYNVTSSGKLFYTLGPGGDIDTGIGTNPFNSQFNSQFGGGAGARAVPATMRPDKIEAAFLRQLTESQPNQIDYYLDILQSMEDYNRIALKQLQSFPEYVFYDPAWPLGKVFAWPVPQANIYGLFITVKEQLPVAFPSLATLLNLPYEYYGAILYNLAIRLCAPNGLPVRPDTLGLAKDGMRVIRGSNTAIARLQMPPDMQRAGIYNIFSDRNY